MTHVVLSLVVFGIHYKMLFTIMFHINVYCLALLLFSFTAPNRKLITGTYNNFFRIFDRQSKEDYCYEASRDMTTLGQILRHKKVTQTAARKRKDEVGVDSLDFNRKILHAAWHPRDNILAIAATNNLYLFHEQQP